MARLKEYTGVYMILNLTNGRFYIGGAVRFYNRMSVHKHFLRVGRGNRNLQADWDDSSSDNFLFELLEECSTDNLRAREQFWFDNALPEYNIELTTTHGKGVVHSIERRRKQSEAQLRLLEDPAERQKRSERATRQWAEGKLGRKIYAGHP